MKKITLFAALTVCAISFAQSPISPIKPLTNGNPINPYNFCADPTAIEYEGRVYLYGTNDQQQFDTNGGSESNSYGSIKELVMMSSADMVNWTWHGTINVKDVCKWCGNSWAPSITSRVQDDGLTHFYLYFANGAGGVGVMTSTSPTGPWTDPLGHALISWGTPGIGDVVWLFDPGVTVDDNGTGWLAFGGGGPNQTGTSLMPGNTRIVKLNDDMISFASDIAVIPTPYHFEASELNYIGGKYVYSYCTSWSDRNNWNQYGSSKGAPSTCSMCYMTSTDPLNPDSWTYEGEIFKNPGAFGYSWGNNHTHLQKFGSKYYFFYHTQALERFMGIDKGYRSLAVNVANVDEANATIRTITATNEGVSQIKQGRPIITERQEAEMLWNAAGVKAKPWRDGYVIDDIQVGAWTAVKSAYAENEVKSFSANLRGQGVLEVRLDNINSEPVATVNFDNRRYKDYTVDLTTPFKGLHTIYFVFTDANSLAAFDFWQFSEELAGIDDCINAPEIEKKEYFTLSGTVCDKPTAPGIYIVKTTHNDATSTVEKIIVK